jgi:regulatory protein
VSTADGERIAPVTWLFGDAPQPPVTQPLRPHSPTPSAVSSTIVGPALQKAEAVQEAESIREVESIQEVQKKPRDKGSFDRINNVSMYALARRGMSSREMHDYLVGREFDAQSVAEEIDRLEGVGLLDDGLLAETLVRTLRDRKGLGRSALTAELRRRKVDGAAIELALEVANDDELERAVEIAVKRAPQLRNLDSTTAKRRLGAFLMRKGYSGSVVSTAVARALEPSGPVFR